MSRITTIMKREFSGYFATPVAYVFIVVLIGEYHVRSQQVRQRRLSNCYDDRYPTLNEFCK